MSWQAYVDTSLVGTGKIDKAAIFSAAGDSLWAATAGYLVKPEEIKALARGFGDNSELYSKGLLIASEKFFIIKANNEEILGKKDKEGIVCVKTTQAILVAHHLEGVLIQDALKVVTQLKDYMKGLGY